MEQILCSRRKNVRSEQRDRGRERETQVVEEDHDDYDEDDEDDDDHEIDNQGEINGQDYETDDGCVICMNKVS